MGGVLGLINGHKQFGKTIRLKRKYSNLITIEILKGGRDLSEILIQQLNKKTTLVDKWNYTISKIKECV